ncbi:leucine rich repeat (LRR) protein [Spirosoma oryzae]|uniref:non-specific serine/threonine protein kinase n=1 Tax=Spirosoma oryzae TaxID=1469603 RepID=A0A2T0TI20_9BACT|nr:leucine rich repeat (LRR) protein [Spirosoma oryzae]
MGRKATYRLYACIAGIYLILITAANAQPALITLTASNSLSCEQKQATLVAVSNCVAGSAYQFTGPDGFVAMNTTGVISVSVDGSYSVAVDNGAGCKGSASVVVGSTLHPDYLPLVDLYNSTGGANWTNKSGWLGNCDPCSGWFGIRCANGRVTNISFASDFPGNNLNGTVPQTIGKLSALTTLNLSYQPDLRGSIPASIGNLSNLQDINLAYTHCSGFVLDKLTSLTALQSVDISYANFVGTIPETIANLSQLKVFNCGANAGLGGNIPASVGNLTKLERLVLGTNQFTGTVPASLGNLTALTTLYLSDNQLTGSIPAELGKLTQLQTLYLSGNQLAGAIPEQLGNLTQIKRLGVDNNQLSGTIPTSLSALTQAEYLYFGQNRLVGSVPDVFGSFAKLTELTLNDNQLMGSIPASLGSVPTLHYLQLQNNKLTGCIPSSFTALCGKTVDISNNVGLPAWNEFCDSGYNGLVTVTNGSWQDPATWSCGRVPALTDIVTLRHAVTVKAGSASQARRIDYDGLAKLIYEAGGITKLGN